MKFEEEYENYRMEHHIYEVVYEPIYDDMYFTIGIDKIQRNNSKFILEHQDTPTKLTGLFLDCTNLRVWLKIDCTVFGRKTDVPCVLTWDEIQRIA